MRRSIALLAILGLGAMRAEALERTRIYLDFDRGGLSGYGIDYRDGYRYREHYRYGPPYGRAYGYWDRRWFYYDAGYRDGWRDARRWDDWHDRRRVRHHERWRSRDCED